MAERTQRQRHDERDDDEIAPSPAEGERTSLTSSDELDDLLDEIDEVLEHNAEEFVRSYVQKGGQ